MPEYIWPRRAMMLVELFEQWRQGFSLRQERSANREGRVHETGSGWEPPRSDAASLKAADPGGCFTDTGDRCRYVSSA
jgi:hypothetical protein